MFSKSAEFYDIIYSKLKDYQAEAKTIAEILRRIHPSAKTVLDVACGTGEHIRHLQQDHGFQADGIDLDNGLLEVARRKNPGSTFTVADMTKFALGKKYDVVMCLFSSIGYVKALPNVTATLLSFKKHLADNGLILVEPWFSPDAWEPRRVFMNTVDTEDLKLCRMSFSEGDGTLSRLRFEYLIGTKEGIHHEVEHHELGLFTVDQMKQCFKEAQLNVEYDPQGPYGRGLYMARAVA